MTQELTDKERKILLDLIRMAWSGGAVRSEEQGEDLKALKEKLSQPDASEGGKG